MNLNFKKIFIRCGIAFIFGIIFGWAIFPSILRVMIKKQVALKKGSQLREMWEVVPFPLHFHIYVFNITNPKEFEHGEKPIVEEIGPYYFDEWKAKYNLEDDEAEDSVSYNMKNTYIFRPDKSNGLTGEEIITIPDILYLSIGIVVKNERAPMLNLVSKALQIVFSERKATFTGKFLDIFFRGIYIDCSSHEFPAKALCSEFYSNSVKSVSQYNDTHFLFSIMGSYNGTNIGRYTACRGLKNIHKLGKVIRFENEPEMNYWSTDECNKIRGTDGTIFPPFMKPEENLWAFVPGLCRSMGPYSIGKSKYGGIPAFKYYLDMGDIQADENLHCFCDDPPNNCPLKGTMNLMSCVEGPLVASMPHFFNGDPKLLEDAIGLNPDREKHAIFVDFERITGAPLKALIRLQFNLRLENIEEIKTMSNLSEMIMPIFWVEEGLQLNKTYVNMIKYTLVLGLIFNNIVKWSCVIFGAIGAIASGYLHYKKSQIHVVNSEGNKSNNMIMNHRGENADNGVIKEIQERF